MKKLPLFALTLLAFLSTSCAAATIVNVADYGVVPGVDVSAKANRIVESLRGHEDITLFFPKGQYEFYPEEAVNVYRAVTNHDNSMRRLAFPLFGIKNVTIDGNGSTFMFHGKITPFAVEGSEGITLKNFTIDWDTPFHHELRVVKSDPKSNSFEAEVYPMKYGFEVKGGELLLNHYDWQHVTGQNIAFDPKTKAPIYMTRSYQLRHKGVKAKKIGENRVLLKKQTRKTPPVGTIFNMYGPSPGGNRFAEAIHLSNSKDTKIENVTVLAAGGMGVIAERCENIHLDQFVITSREDRNFSTRADATHFLGCKGEIRVENSRLEHMGDDGINVHGAYVKVEKYKGEKTFLCAISHVQQAGLIFAGEGDRVLIISRETLLPLFETTVTAVEILDDKQVLVTVDEVPEKMPRGVLSMENLTWNPELIFRNNVVRDNRARGALITTKGDVLIEGNTFSSQMHGILIEGDNNKWYESGGVQNITINNNTFENIGYGSGKHYPLYAAPLFTDVQKKGDDQYHRNIRFTNNKLKSFNGLLVHALSVENLVVTGNTIEFDDYYPAFFNMPSVDLDFCKNVVIENNQFKGFEQSLETHVSRDSSNIKIRSNSGLKN